MTSNYDFCSEFYIVEKIIELVTKIGDMTKHMRIEILHDIRNEQYHAISYYMEFIKIQPRLTENENDIESKWVWLFDDNFPSMQDDNADILISRVLGELELRYIKSNEIANNYESENK